MLVSLSSDGDHIIPGSYHHTIQIWAAQSGDIFVGPWRGHTRAVTSVVYSPDGTRILSNSIDRTIRIWDVQSGDVIAGLFSGYWLYSLRLFS
jgi:WD40 repeat protein